MKLNEMRCEDLQHWGPYLRADRIALLYTQMQSMGGRWGSRAVQYHQFCQFLWHFHGDSICKAWLWNVVTTMLSVAWSGAELFTTETNPWPTAKGQALLWQNEMPPSTILALEPLILQWAAILTRHMAVVVLCLCCAGMCWSVLKFSDQRHPICWAVISLPPAQYQSSFILWRLVWYGSSICCRIVSGHLYSYWPFFSGMFKRERERDRKGRERYRWREGKRVREMERGEVWKRVEVGWDEARRLIHGCWQALIGNGGTGEWTHTPWPQPLRSSVRRVSENEGWCKHELSDSRGGREARGTHLRHLLLKHVIS